MAGEIYLEIIPVDKALRVTAVDSATGVEVVFTAPGNASRSRIDRVAAAKLKARIERERQATSPQITHTHRERGKLV